MNKILITAAIAATALLDQFMDLIDQAPATAEES